MAKRDFLVDVDFNKQQSLNMKLQSLGTNPTLTINDGGFTYWNTADNKIYTWSGTTWFTSGDMILAAIQSVTGLKTFDTSKLAMLANANTGVTTFANLNASVTNYTQSFPAKSGTFAMTSDVPTVTPAALTKTDDTNVTLTLGGTPATALLQAASLTLGWTGVLSGTRGGTGVNNGASTITLGGSLTTVGAFATTLTTTGITSLTLPTSGTLATTAQIPISATYITATADATLTNEFALGSLATGLLRNTTTTGIPTIATDAQVTSHLLTGYVSGAGTIASTDTILQAFNKINGNVALLTGAIIYQGVWNASTNTPTLVSGVGTKGYMYKVSVAGTTNIDGNAYWVVGDMIVFNGTVWDRIEGSATEVTSVFGRVGVVVGAAADYSGVAMTGITSLNGLVITSNTGVVTTGTWNAGTIAAIYGGTGITTYATGDLLIGGPTANTLTKLPDVATGQVLISGGVGAAPSYSSTPTAATAAVNTNNTQLATTAFVVAEITNKAGTSGADGSVVRRKSQTIGDGVALTYAVTHSFGSRAVISQVFNTTTFAVVECEMINTSTSVTTFNFNVAPTTNQYTVVIFG